MKVKSVIRKIAPATWLNERQTFLRLGRQAGSHYARLRLFDSLGIHVQNFVTLKPMAQSFLFVCFGNIMRSPMAEALFRRSVETAGLANIQAGSAGLHATPGTPPDRRALLVSSEMGIPLTNQRAQLLTPDLVARADAIFAMDFQNKAELLAGYPDHREKILLLSVYADGPQRFREIADPYEGDLNATRRCYSTLQTCIRNFTIELLASRANKSGAH